MSKSSTWDRLRTIDKLLFVLLLPVWLGTLIVHFDLAMEQSLRRPAIFMSDAPAGGYPRVEFIAGGAETLVALSRVRIGDELLRIQDRDMQGLGGLQAGIASFALIDGQAETTALFRRGEVEFSTAYPFSDFGIPWWWPTLFGVSFGFVGFLMLWRAPTSRAAQAVFPAFVSFAITWQIMPGRSEEITTLSIVSYGCSMIFAAPLLLRAIMFLPENRITSKRWAHWLPWIFALMAVSGSSLFFGVPLNPDLAQSLHFALVSAFYLSVMVILARNYLRADKLGRRQLRWILLGFYFAFLPAFIVTLSAIVLPAQLNLYALSSLGMPIIPVMFLIAIVQTNLFDIDRLIGGSVSYSILVVVIAIFAEAFVEPLVAFMGTRFGYDGDTVQLIFVAGLTALLIPVQRRWRPLVDRIFFAEGLVVEDAIDDLIDRVDKLTQITEEERMVLVGTELSKIYQLEGWTVFTLPEAGGDQGAYLGTMSDIFICSDHWSRYKKRVRPGLETLDDGNRYLFAPIRPNGALRYLLALGPKRSGDVYTPTDNGLIASLTHIVALQIGEQEAPV